MRNNGNIGDKQVKFYSPSIELFLMGADPPTKLSDSLQDGATDNYFRNYRNQTLSRVIMPRYQWDDRAIPYSPKPDLAGTKRQNYEIIMPKHNISSIDQIRMKEVDDIYKAVQLHREQYKDRTGKLHPLIYFKADQYKYQCAPSMVSSYFTKYPTRYTEYKMPVVLPLTYGRRMRTPYRPDFSLSGIYNRSGCVAFKQ